MHVISSFIKCHVDIKEDPYIVLKYMNIFKYNLINILTCVQYNNKIKGLYKIQMKMIYLNIDAWWIVKYLFMFENLIVNTH